jgi:hypothetical protein
VKQLQRTVGNRAVGRLLARTVQRQSNNIIQRLLEYPYTPEGERLEGPPQKIDLTAATYQQLIKYKSIWNEKQLGAPHRQWEFEPGDVDELDRLIAEKEGDLTQVTEVICPEGEVKVALPTQIMRFGDITSCMAISLILDDNTVISAHNGLMATIGNGGLTRINQIKADRFNERQAVRVRAIGAGGLWDTSIRGVMHPSHDSDSLVSDNPNDFVTYLRGQLNAPAGNFHEHAEGSASISATGDYIQG